MSLRSNRSLILILSAFILCWGGMVNAQQSLESPSRELLKLDLNEQILRIPLSSDPGVQLQTTVFKPNGPGPFPLLLMNHGKDPGNPKSQKRDRFYHLAAAFVKR